MRSARLLTLALAPFLASSMVGCGGDDSTAAPDAGMHVDAGPADSGVMDSGPPDAGPSMLFGPCTVDSQCPGDNAVCWQPVDGWAGGYCTVPCVDRRPCDDGVVYHDCLPDPQGGSQMFCERKCLNGVDCMRSNYTCAGTGVSPSTGETTAGDCVGLCASDSDCGSGSKCNVEANTCVASDATITGSKNGGSCAANSDCQSGNCIPATNAQTTPATPTGFNGGYCTGDCILPNGYNSNSLYSGDTLPQGTCPDHEVCFPNSSLTGGDLGTCWAACTSDADCRQDEGYSCLNSFTLTSGTPKTFTNGFCVPIDCSAGASCPTGYTCVTMTDSTGATSGVCTPM